MDIRTEISCHTLKSQQSHAILGIYWLNGQESHVLFRQVIYIWLRLDLQIRRACDIKQHNKIWRKISGASPEIHTVFIFRQWNFRNNTWCAAVFICWFQSLALYCPCVIYSPPDRPTDECYVWPSIFVFLSLNCDFISLGQSRQNVREEACVCVSHIVYLHNIQLHTSITKQSNNLTN